MNDFLQLRYNSNDIIMINLINQRCQFNEDLEGFPTAGLTLSILGTQSSGKSTLLNHVFQSDFPTLQASMERTRCTTGVSLQHLPKFNIIDTEGFDSMERGDDEKIFQKQMSLFVVVISDVIMINLYMDEIGRYTGGHMDILDAIFKVGERLVTPQKKKIIYIIRDCSEDADRNILSSELTEEIKTLSKEYSNKQLKYSIEFYFMSHYIYQPEQFIEESKKLLPKISIQRGSTLNNYKEEDRVRYLRELWVTIKDSKTALDLKSIDDALKSYVMERIRKEIIGALEESLGSLRSLQEVKTYQRFYQVLNRSILDYLTEHRPKHIKEKELEGHVTKIFGQFEPIATKHFNNVVLSNIEEELIQDIEREISKNSKNKRLSHLIFKKKKEMVDAFKKVVDQHQEYPLLLKNFNDRVGSIIVREQNRLSHLFSLFQGTVERELNVIMGRQAAKLEFNEKEIRDKIKALCQEYQYQEWEVDFVAIWEKVSYRCLEKIVPETIAQKSRQTITGSNIFSNDQTTSIIATHTNLEKTALDFCREVLFFMQEENTLVQPLNEIKDIVRQCLKQRLSQDQRRWKVSMLVIAFVLFMLCGELESLLSFTSIKKRNRRMYIRLYYWGTFLLFMYCSSKHLVSLKKKIFDKFS